MKKTYSNQQLGILGGGQLARMLAHEAQRMGYGVRVLSSSPNDPAAQVTGYHHAADPNDPKAIEQFFRNVDVATFESEFMNADKLALIAKQTQTKIFPDPKHMAKIQDRLTQKKLLDNYKIQTSPWMAVNSWDELENIGTELGYPFVLKTRRYGYDGYGTIIVKNKNQIKSLKNQDYPEFGFIAEQFIPFKRELAIMIGRNRSGDMVTLPWVESFQEDSRCLWVKGPVASNAAKFQSMNKKLKLLISKEKYVGIIGFELFDTGKNLIINELAPRVHNSGHYSLDALHENQFTIHIKAILDQKFSKPSLTSSAFAMYNLLGSGKNVMSWNCPSDVFLHWYGKNESRRGRKMGHLNSTGTSTKKCLDALKRARKEFKI